MKNLFIYILLLSASIGCKNHYKDAEKFESLLEHSTGQQHSTAKLWTQEGYYVVYKNDVTGEFTAYNLDKFDRKKMKELSAFTAIATESDIVHALEPKAEWVESGYWEQESYTENVCDADWNCWSETRYRDTNNWIDTSGYVTFYYGGGFRFENAQSRSHDLETLAALNEDAAISFMSSRLQSDFALSADRASTLANLSLRYQRLESVRELTEKEKDLFALEALGVSVSQIETSLRKKESGDEQEYLELLKKSATVNRTTPEKIGQFFEDYINL